MIVDFLPQGRLLMLPFAWPGRACAVFSRTSALGKFEAIRA
ncbi:MAG: hypothetical protein ACREDJ_04345 [Methylocella sp.]